MPTASLEEVAVHALVPRALDQQQAERLRRALGTPLTEAVPAAFDILDDLDPGAYWVIREVHARVQVPISEPDPARSASAIARAMAAAVTDVVLRGPSADAVRFANRAAYLAAYLRARLVGGESWVFARLATIGALSPLDALPAGARVLDVGLLDAVTALARTSDWERLLDAAQLPSADRVWGALARLAGPDGAVDLAVLDAVAALRAESPAAVRGRSAGARRLRLLGLRARAADLTLADVAAVQRLEPDDGDERRDLPTDLSPSPSTRRDRSADGTTPEEVAAAVGHDSMGEEPTEPWVLRCAGAIAFLLVADLAEVLESEEAAAWLLEPEPAAGEIRAAALAAVIGRGVDRDDAAVRLAAGVETVPDDELDLLARGVPRFSEPLLSQEHPDDRVWFAPVLAQAPAIEPLARALARRFAAHLHGFGGAGLPYLADRVMPLGGSVRVTEDTVLVDLPRPPLHVLLAMAGLDAFSCQVPWLDLPVLVTHEEEW